MKGIFRLVFFFLGATGVAALGTTAMAAPQQPEVSLGDAARKARAQKKPPVKPAKVWTNEDMAGLNPFGVNVVGTVPPVPVSVAAPGTPAEADAAAGKERTAATDRRLDLEADLATEREHLAAAQKELDLAQRDFQLAQQQFYSNPNSASDSAGKKKLDDMQATIKAKEQDVSQSQAKIADLTRQLEELKRASAPETPETPPKQP